MKIIKTILAKFGYIHKSEIPKQETNKEFTHIINMERFDIKDLKTQFKLNEFDKELFEAIGNVKKIELLRKRALQEFSNEIMSYFDICIFRDGSDERIEFEIKILARKNNEIDELFRIKPN